MKLENLFGPQKFLYLERYVNEDSKTYSPFAKQNEADPKYQPTGNTESFEIHCVEIPKDKVVIYFDQPESKLRDFYVQQDTVLFPVHPEILDEHVELKKYPFKSLFVSPTASTR